LYSISDDTLYPPEKMREFYVYGQEVLDVEYEEVLGEPVKFIQFMKDVWQGCPDLANRIAHVQEWVGMALAGKVVETENHLLLQGSSGGKNGKSRFMKIVQGLFPEIQRTSFGFKDLENSFMLSALEHSRLNILADAPASLVNSSMLKQVLSGDTIRADRKFKDSINVSSRAAWIIGINDSFVPSERDEAIYRRFTVLTFPRTFTELESKNDISEEILREEKAQIIMWAIEGLKRRMHAGGWTPVPSSPAAIHTWRQNVDPLFAWFENHVEVIKEERAGILPGLHYEAYRDWAKRGGHHPVSETKFGLAANSRNINCRPLIGGKQVRLHKVRIIEETDLSALRAEDIMGDV